MAHGLRLQTDREIRFEQRCQRKKIEQQKVDRVIRLEIRETSRDDAFGNNSEMVDEVSSEIVRLTQKRSNITNSYSSFVSHFC
jgi:histone H3/H4|tara:strand:- start:16 stop:264 length:249 start_codon:yes stop_codon:yes gene_type:complete